MGKNKCKFSVYFMQKMKNNLYIHNIYDIIHFDGAVS